ncbi:MAG: M28 family peptidase [Wenzhouxiangellaceae bacterium]|nr:M28 family peptidase [Wenzhouxiangellaceae bacterium]
MQAADRPVPTTTPPVGAPEAARVFSQHKFAGSIVYAALAGEEQGLFGGQILAARAIEENRTITAVLNNEMIGNIAGYKIYWGLTTEPTWTRSWWVGDVSALALENVVTDNYFFGVASVAVDGTDSPVVFPGPAGAFPESAPAQAETA